MQTVVIYLVGVLILLYVLRCAFTYGHRTRLMPPGELPYL